MPVIALYRRHPRLSFLVIGVVVAWASFGFIVNWYRIFHDLLGMSVMFDTRPIWLRILMKSVELLPWAAILAVFVLKYPFKKPVHPLAFAAGIVGFEVYVIGSLLLGPGAEGYLRRQTFDSQRWIQNDRSDFMWPTRLTMVDDLLAHQPLTGISRDSVEALLGPPDSTPYWKDWDLVYRLGPERGLIRLDSEWLVLRLDANGRVTEYSIVRD